MSDIEKFRRYAAVADDLRVSDGEQVGHVVDEAARRRPLGGCRLVVAEVGADA